MFAAEFETAVMDRRRTPRAPVSLDGRLGRGGLERALGKVVNLSIHGARVQSYSAMTKGSTIWLTLPGQAPVAADVIWADDFTAGGEFRDALTAEQFASLVDH